MTRLALWWLTRQMRRDSAYAWSWHCNIAMSAVDEGMPHAAANRAAARFLSLLVPGYAPLYDYGAEVSQ